MPNIFSHEMTNLFTIMTIFDLSYFIRLIANSIYFVTVTMKADDLVQCKDREGMRYACDAFKYVLYE